MHISLVKSLCADAKEPAADSGNGLECLIAFPVQADVMEDEEAAGLL